MICRYKFQRRYFFIILVVLFLFPSIVLGADKENQPRDGSIEGWVSSINKEILYIDGKEYRLSENVKVFIGSENGWEITLNTITDVGYITHARIHVNRGMVQKIIILEVQQ